MPLPKTYDPKASEDRIYEMWEKSGAFRPESCKDEKAETFTISMPPPNATGQLHLGHSVMLALQDIFIRFNRMRGKRVLWVPGTDHASIATESVVIKQIQKEENIPDPRAKLGREELIRRIADFVDKSRGTIRGQVRKMGASCDWSRERYTLDPTLNRCVSEVFVKMYQDGLIYRGHRAVNWDPKMQTTVSDDEIEYIEEKTPYYTFQYGPFQISTARPETKFGDKYVVMHPADKRYAKYKDGETFTAEWINGPVKATVIKDKIVDPEFGTGVMTITPWHDMTDFELSERHKLEREQIIGFDGRLLQIAGEFAGMPIEEARPKVVEKLKAKGLLVKVDKNYVHRVAVSYRGKGIVEPQIKEQWFIDVNKKVVTWEEQEGISLRQGFGRQEGARRHPATPFGLRGARKGELFSLKEIMQSVVRNGEIKIIPERFEKVYFNWIDNLRDWCISRQIWWGHRVPVYYCSKCGDAKNAQTSDERSAMSDEQLTAHSSQLTAGGQSGIIVSSRPIDGCPHCGGVVHQDPDTLDTWFSSGLWTWSTLIDPSLADDFSISLDEMLKRSPDFQDFHPTQILETAADILFFWVARMILMTTYATGEIPFETVYLHGLVLDRNGEKMSKSHPETAIDPLDIIPKYGADALRLSMTIGQSPGNDTRLYEEKIAGYRNFVNKLWNAARFVLIQCEKEKLDPKAIIPSAYEPKTLADFALFSELLSVRGKVTLGLENYAVSVAGDSLYSFVWDFFCDWYLELSKGESNLPFLVNALREILQLLHPFCPFVTEELWSSLKHENADILIKHPWPVDIALAEGKGITPREQFQVLIDVISAIRKLRVEQEIEAGKDVAVFIYTKKHAELLQSQEAHIRRLGHVGTLMIDAKPVKHTNVASAFLSGTEIHLSLEGLFDPVKVKKSLLKEQTSLVRYRDGLLQKLRNQDFVSRAPASLVEAEKGKLTEVEEKLKKIDERLAHTILHLKHN
ncbi:valine--tRNA ligase [Candidatus Peribacteria bacterium RIFCSPHIGHO2_02_FULL_51_15]|nr:MAG: valine--tRNA ligase [Candidatus Peribacteria bacterium RIFCSPHIGHO2_02_FULL_51_15]